MKHKLLFFISMFFCCCMLCGHKTSAVAAPAALTGLTFDADYYYNTNPDLQAALGYNYDSLYSHYLNFGLAEGRSGSPEFNCQIYRNNYGDLQAAFGNNFYSYCVHYETYGRAEGRNAAGYNMVPAEEAPAPEESIPAPAGTLIGSYSTAFDPNLPRAINLCLAASRINGIVVQPGAGFSFSQAILPRTAANGYVPADIIVNNQFVPGMGGGICQVSSTLYAAMLSANLPATERHPHSLRISYVPEGLDSTISGNTLDLKFTNIFPEPIQIQAYADQGILTILIYKL